MNNYKEKDMQRLSEQLCRRAVATWSVQERAISTRQSRQILRIITRFDVRHILSMRMMLQWRSMKPEMLN